MEAGSEVLSAVVRASQHQLGGGEEEDIRVSDGLGVGVGLGIEHGPGRRGGVKGSKRVEWSGVEWSGVGRKINPH